MVDFANMLLAKHEANMIRREQEQQLSASKSPSKQSEPGAKPPPISSFSLEEKLTELVTEQLKHAESMG